MSRGIRKGRKQLAWNVALAKRLWNTKTRSKDIADRCGVSVAAMYHHAKRQGWGDRQCAGWKTRRDRRARGEAPPVYEIKDTVRTLTVRCQDCYAEYPVRVWRLKGMEEPQHACPRRAA